MGFEEARGEFLVRLMSRYATHGSSILELGCRAGKNIAPLFDAGFEDICGVEEDARRVGLLSETHPRLGAIRIINAPVKEAVTAFADGGFDVVFTVGFFEGPRGGHARLFAEMARVARSHLVIIEDERPRGTGDEAVNYRDVFEPLGFTQVEETALGVLPELESVFTARIFEKR